MQLSFSNVDLQKKIADRESRGINNTFYRYLYHINKKYLKFNVKKLLLFFNKTLELNEITFYDEQRKLYCCFCSYFFSYYC